MAGKQDVDFVPNMLVVGEYCQACAAAKKLYAKEIESGEIKVVDIMDAISEEKAIPGLADCLWEKDEIGIPVLAKVEEGKVVACRIGIPRPRN